MSFSSSVVSDSMRPHGLQNTRPPCPSPTPRDYPNSCPLSWWCHPTMSSSVIPFFSCLHISQYQGLSTWVSSLYQVAKVLELQLQHQSFQWTSRPDLFEDGLVGSPCSPRDSQESFPAAQLKHQFCLTLTSTHDCWKNHRFDYTDLCQQSVISDF